MDYLKREREEKKESEKKRGKIETDCIPKI